jgi:hypothetical protein
MTGSGISSTFSSCASSSTAANLAAVREACLEIFELRDTHTWPPQVTVYPSWAAGFAAMAADVRFYTDDVDVAAEALREFIAEIDAAT